MKPSLALPILFAALLVAGPVAAQNAPAPAGAQPKAKRNPAPAAGAGTPLLGFGSNSKEPIKVDANRLEVFDKESRAVYSGDVVVVQGQTIMRCSTMVVNYAQGREAGATRTAGPSAQTSIRQIDCEGPVSLLSGTQSATSQKLVYEAEKDIVTLTGKVVIADCDNVQRGERAVYDVKTGRATVDAGPTGRVQGVFTPGSEDKTAPPPRAAAAPARGAASATPDRPQECPPPGGAAPAAPKAEAAPRAAPAANTRNAPQPGAPMPLRP
jgi:lipopolysaccharide export system protein LptA